MVAEVRRCSHEEENADEYQMDEVVDLHSYDLISAQRADAW